MKVGIAAIAVGGAAIAALVTYLIWAILQASDALSPDDPELTFDLFAGSLPANAQRLAPIFWQVYQETGISPFILAGICAQESDFGDALSPPGDGGTGDGGHGRGLMQIDDRSNATWVANSNWGDAYINISMGASVLKAKAQYLALRGVSSDQLLRASVAAYNTGEGNVLKSLRAGLDPDTTTADGNYSTRVIDHFAATYAAAAGTSVGALGA